MKRLSASAKYRVMRACFPAIFLALVLIPILQWMPLAEPDTSTGRLGGTAQIDVYKSGHPFTTESMPLPLVAALPGLLLIGDLKSLRDERGKVVAKMRGMQDSADKEKRALTAEEQKPFDDAYADQEALRVKIEREERLIEAERQIVVQALASERAAPADDLARKSTARANPIASPEYRKAFSAYLAGGDLRGIEEWRDGLQADVDVTGGYLIAPESMVTDLIKAVDDLVFIRRLATRYSIPQAKSMGAASLDADPSDADWTTELATGNLDSTMAFGKRKLEPHPFAKRIKVSRDLLTMATQGAEALVRARMAYKFAVTEEKAFLTGSGANQPLGIFTASNDGIPTSRDISADNTTTTITADGLINAKFALKGNYWARAQWLFHRDAMKQITKLKDGDGQYLWLSSMRDGQGDRILGLPVNMSEYVPNTFTTGLYVGGVGDFSNYWIVDALDMQIQRMIELYAETNQVGFIGRQKTDGMPVLSEAFVRVKLA